MDFTTPSVNIAILGPVLVVGGWGLLLMLVDLFLPPKRRYWFAWLTMIGLVVALGITISQWGQSGGAFTPSGGTPMVVMDNFSHFLNLIFLLTGILAVMISLNYLRKVNLEKAEYYMLLLFSLSGMMLMGMANDLILIFLALELLSIPLYIMAGFAHPRPESEESAMKYFLLGAFSSGFLVFGIALIYGATGSTALPAVLASLGTSGALGMAGIAMLLVGFGFKVAAVPFHMWTPDV